MNVQYIYPFFWHMTLLYSIYANIKKTQYYTPNTRKTCIYTKVCTLYTYIFAYMQLVVRENTSPFILHALLVKSNAVYCEVRNIRIYLCMYLFCTIFHNTCKTKVSTLKLVSWRLQRVDELRNNCVKLLNGNVNGNSSSYTAYSRELIRQVKVPSQNTAMNSLTDD